MRLSKRMFAVGCLFGIASFSLGSPLVFAADNVVNVNSILPHAGIFFSPASQTITAGSTFDVSIYLNTYEDSANAVDLTVQFPANLLSIVQPSTGNSIVGIWVSPPSYSNLAGTINLTGVIPNGITTGGGLITTISFRALAAGTATVSISNLSNVLANDGQGTQMATEFGQGVYTITPTPPGGVTVFSPTHPFQSDWYNNNNPSLGWNKDPGVDAFSYLLNNQPFTVPDNNASTTTGTSVAYQNLSDGLWYFHMKARQAGIWGTTTNFLLRVDTQPPAEFTPAYQILSVADRKILLSFFTTDNLSGINYYEVGALDDTASSTASPVFVEAQSPYTLNLNNSKSQDFTVIVRAIDNAGNVRDESIAIHIPTPFGLFIQNNSLWITLGLLILILLVLLIHYFFGHKLIPRARRLIGAIEKEEQLEKIEEAKKTISEIERKEGITPSEPKSGDDARGGA